MPWEETGGSIFSGHVDSSQFDVAGQKEIDRGVWAVFGKPKAGGEGSRIVSYRFDKDKGWTIDRAEDWFAKHGAMLSSEGFQSTCIINERHVSGVLAIPRVSRNGFLYLPDELAKADGRSIPVYLEHDYSREPVGLAKLTWDPDLWQLRYEGEVVDSVPLPRHTSLGAEYEFEERIDGYVVPRGLDFYEMSLVVDPGIPETSVVAESARRRLAIVESVSAVRGSSLTVRPSEASLREADGLTAAPQSVSEAGERIELSQQEGNTHGNTGASGSSSVTATGSTAPPRYVTYDDFIDAQEKMLTKLGESLSWAKPGGGKEHAGRKPVLPAEERVSQEPDEDEKEWRFYEQLAEKLFATPQPWQMVETAFRFVVPRLELPSLKAALDDRDYHGGLRERLAALESYNAKAQRLNKRVTEALSTSTSGAGLGVQGVSPIIVVPNSLIANLRDMVNWVDIPRGADRARWATVKVASAGALSENTEPSEASQTLTSVDGQPSPRGLQQSVSYELEQKSVGGSMIQAVVESYRLSYLEDIDNLVASEANGASGIAKTLYGDESVSAEADITSSMTFAPARIATSIKEITSQGYTPDNLIAVLHPVQFDALLKHADVRQAHIFGEKVQITGILPSLYGVEVRRSGKLSTGTGSASTTTYRAFVCKKSVTLGAAASRDLQIETFRDIRKNQTVIKGHWDVAVKTIEPKSLVKIVTA
ncbi:MAG: hypothetical protein HYU39_04610 [Thaumarchaeota archaeon]|nr:hypothetical protein [Nitrososphaerota archaeon]